MDHSHFQLKVVGVALKVVRMSWKVVEGGYEWLRGVVRPAHKMNVMLFDLSLPSERSTTDLEKPHPPGSVQGYLEHKK